MVQSPQRTAFSGPKLVRLLAGLSRVIPESGQSLSDRLSQWLGWTDAIALSTVLDGSSPGGSRLARIDGSDDADPSAAVRISLKSAIDSACGSSSPARRGRRVPAPAPVVPEDAAAGYAPFRQRYLSMQQVMEMDIGNLRGRLRGRLSAGPPELARLAAVDAVMEQALGPRERTLLAGVPALLKVHFERLRDEAETQATHGAEISGEAAALNAGAWLNVFRKDMQSVLLAELDVRFQPVEGLLAALRTS